MVNQAGPARGCGVPVQGAAQETVVDNKLCKSVMSVTRCLAGPARIAAKMTLCKLDSRLRLDYGSLINTLSWAPRLDLNPLRTYICAPVARFVAWRKSFSLTGISMSGAFG